MIKRKPNPGTLIEIRLSNDWFAYGQVLKNGSIAFFDTYKEQRSNIEHLAAMDVIFIVTPYNHAYRNENWNSKGKTEIRQELQKVPNTFIQDVADLNKFQIYNPNTDEIRKSSREECLSLERFAVWDANHIEDRLRDHFSGKENVWVKQLSIK